jgi:PAS domain S-box-containing protein
VGYIEHYLSVFEKIRAGEYIKLELFLRDNAPQLTWAEAVCNPIFDKDGAISGMCFTTTDITERKQAEQALQLSEMHLRILLDNIPQTFFLVDNKGILLLFNKKAEEAFRDIFNTNLVTGRTLEEQLPLEYNGFFKEAISATLKDQNYKVEVLLPLNTINILWAEVICNPIYGADGTVQYVCFTSTDITERKQAEQALQSSEYRLRTLMDNIQQTFFLLDKNGTLLLNNKVVTRAFRLVFRTRLFTGRTLLEQLPVKYQEQFSTAFAAILTGQSFTTELLVPGPHGKKLWAEVVGNPIFAANGTVSSICFTSSNITERKQAEQALRESEERFSKMLAAAPIPIALAYKGVYTEVNEAFEKFTGYSRAETLGNYAPKFLKFTPEDSATLEWLLRQHGAVKEFETRVITRSGEERDIILSIEKIEISGLVYTLAISYDITERKKAEQALRTSEARLRSLMDNTQQYFFLLDTDLRIQFVNKQVGEYYHKVRNLNYVPDKPFSNYFLPQYLEENLELLYRARNGEVINTELYRTEQDGTRRIWHGWASPVREEDGNISGVCVTLIDITERKQAEQELKEALVEKEVLLKEVHHRVKNNLQIISSLLKLQGTVTQEPEALTILKDSQQRIRSIALIHEKLYQSDNLSQVNFGEYLRSLANQLLRSYQTVELELEMENLDSLWLGLDQAIPCGLIVNELLTNSLKYAFPPDYKKQAKITIDMQLNQKENYIRLTISDNGIGLPEGLDPANTETLGYQLVEMLTRQLDGHLIIGSKPDTGTRIEIGFRI